MVTNTALPRCLHMISRVSLSEYPARPLYRSKISLSAAAYCRCSSST